MKTKNKIWVRLFINIAVVFAAFVLCVVLASSTLFKGYYTNYEKGRMRACALQVSQISIEDRDAALLLLQSAESGYNVSLTLYQNNIPVYSTLRRPAGAHRPDINGFDLLINRPDDITLIEQEKDGEQGVFSRITGGEGEMLVYTYAPADNGLSVEVRMEQSVIENSSLAAGRFMIIIAAVCLLGALAWSVLFARRFVKPIENMNSVAIGMASLDFSRKVEIESDDEIGNLGRSLNELSASLDNALSELNERNRRLQNEIDAERRLDQMRKGFVANVSHELKTPISIIQGYAEGLDGADDEQRKKYCEIILDESRRMNELVIGLLELSRYESGVGTNKGVFDLSASLINLADCNRSSLEAKRVLLSLEFPERLDVVGDRVMTEQVIQNYLSNAISHVNEGGTIKIYTQQYEQGVRVCVYNSGSHIDEERTGDLWQSFWRADQSHNRAEGRYGLGLSIVRAIMTSAGLDYGVFNTDDGVVFWAQVELE